ncbi:hypothetical protein [Bacillus bingmayongensis]|nr:hypothetical protein [Bacillus bingmayongensis]
MMDLESFSMQKDWIHTTFKEEISNEARYIEHRTGIFLQNHELSK